MPKHAIVSQDEWLAARKELLKEEKEFTRLRDRLTAKCRELPWVKVEAVYVFDGPDGQETLADLFDGHSQLIVNHFMLGPGWTEGSAYARGSEMLGGVYGYLDHLPKGRNETGPNHDLSDWVRHHDKYD